MELCATALPDARPSEMDREVKFSFISGLTCRKLKEYLTLKEPSDMAVVRRLISVWQSAQDIAGNTKRSVCFEGEATLIVDEEKQGCNVREGNPGGRRDELKEAVESMKNDFRREVRRLVEDIERDRERLRKEGHRRNSLERNHRRDRRDYSSSDSSSDSEERNSSRDGTKYYLRGDAGSRKNYRRQHSKVSDSTERKVRGDYGKMECFGCGGLGHMQSECPTKKRQIRPPDSRNASKERDSCRRCEGKGHHEYECPTALNC